MRLLSHLEKRKDVWIALVLSLFFFLARFPSLFEPNWYGDEGIYQAIGRALRAGKLLYVGTWDNKPPTLYYLYAFFDANQFQIRLFSLIIGILSLIVFFYLSQKLFNNIKASILTSILFIFFFGSPVLEGNIANAENFMLLPSVAAMLLFYLQKDTLLERTPSGQKISAFILGRSKERRSLFLIGLLLGISFTIKIVALFDLVAIITLILFLILPFSKKMLMTHIKPISSQLISILTPLLVGFIFPMFLYFCYFLLKGAVGDFFNAAFLGNVNYVDYENHFLIPQGLLIIRTIILAAVISFLFLKRKTMSFETQLLLVWLTFSLYSVFFSNRPYPHYLLLLIPTACLLLGYSLIKKRFSFILCSLLFCLFTLFYFHVTWTKNPLTYYTNFLSYVTNNKSTEEYQAYFDHNVPRDYAVAEYLRMKVKPRDSIFLWGNNPQIYVLANKIPPGKYTVAYHIAYNKEAIDETNAVLEKSPPEYIVILPGEREKPFSLTNYQYLLTIKDTAIYERIH